MATCSSGLSRGKQKIFVWHCRDESEIQGYYYVFQVRLYRRLVWLVSSLFAQDKFG